MRLIHGLGRARAALVGALASVAGVLGLLSFAPELFLFQQRLAFSLYEIEADIDLEPLDVATHDGLTLRSWYHPPQAGKPVIVYFPGRAGDVIGKPRRLFALAGDGYGLILAGYRGYGGNPGRPSETHLYRDATRLMEQAAANSLAPDGMVLYGYSMGTGIASYLAERVHPRGVVLEAPFTSFRDAVGASVGRVPLWLVRTGFDTRSRMARIDAPILLLAGSEDRITPAHFAETLATLAGGLASLAVLAGAHHDDMFEHGAWEAVTGFLDTLQGAVLPAAEAATLETGGIDAELWPIEP